MLSMVSEIASEFAMIFIEFIDIIPVFASRLIMVIASASSSVLIPYSFVLTAMESDVKSGLIERILPTPIAIALEFASMAITFMSIFSAFALTIYSFIKDFERFS